MIGIGNVYSIIQNSIYPVFPDFSAFEKYVEWIERKLYFKYLDNKLQDKEKIILILK